MSAHASLTPRDHGRDPVYPVGLTFDISFEQFLVRLSILAAHALRFEIADGPYALTETVMVAVTTIRPLVFLVSWVEGSGATVVHVQDFERLKVHSHATLRNGTFLRMAGPIRIVSGEVRR